VTLFSAAGTPVTGRLRSSTHFSGKCVNQARGPIPRVPVQFRRLSPGGRPMPGSPEFDSLNSAKYLYLRELSEPRDNSLRLVVQEAIENRSARPSTRSDNPEFAQILTEAWPIESVESCKIFRLSWKSYRAYSVTEELVGSCGSHDDESYTGRLLRIYTKSHFLEHLARDTGGYTEPIQHYKLICLNHLIDVASSTPPDIRLVESARTP
jgi:hypothetical protein